MEGGSERASQRGSERRGKGKRIDQVKGGEIGEDRGREGRGGREGLPQPQFCLSLPLIWQTLYPEPSPGLRRRDEGRSHRMLGCRSFRLGGGKREGGREGGREREERSGGK